MSGVSRIVADHQVRYIVGSAGHLPHGIGRRAGAWADDQFGILDGQVALQEEHVERSADKGKFLQKLELDAVNLGGVRVEDLPGNRRIACRGLEEFNRQLDVFAEQCDRKVIAAREEPLGSNIVI